MTQLTISVLLSVVSIVTFAQVGRAVEGLPGWQKVVVDDVVGYGVIQKKRAPVVFLIPGSKCLPLFHIVDGKLRSRVHVTDEKFYRKFGFNVLALDRKGIESFTSIPENLEKTDARLRCSESYGGLTLNHRVDDYFYKLKKLSKEPWFGDLVLLGHSEGVDVALKLGNKEDLKVKAVGLLSGVTTNQFLDLVVEQRKEENWKGVFSVIDNLVWVTSDDAEGKFGGYPVERFRSFTVDNTPLESALASSFPLYIANGTVDKKAAVEGADAFVIELLRKQTKRKMSYHNYVALDHDFVDSKGQDKSESVIGAFLIWVKHQEKKREFVLH